MYFKNEREKAIELYIRNDKCAGDVIHKLGYWIERPLKIGTRHM